ncbi:ribonuclease [Sphingosinicella sp. LHD-64]|uniref:ribonuclease n=1 Tax=Sphingosinicella sp. LHD-64 TaxID=3072139 RepID=UPI00280D5882|nr:ribonuclease [Sphingosinicella sp. LHD-64]MDQ8756495.1 ribonuclease [Sphingosinicella sp. LHD-64]
MAEWLYEDGIGENRAILVEDDTIVEAVIELPATIRAGAILPARLTSILIPGRRGIAALDGGEEALIEPLPKALTEGAAFRAEILREAIPEPGHLKRAVGRATDADLRAGPALSERLGVGAASAHGPDRFEQAGWSELLEQAATGEIPFQGGSLRMSLTPAMTLFDVDGPLAPAELAEAGARAAAEAVRRLGIGGSIGIDLPTVPDKAARQRAAAAIDVVLPQPFERTAVNGFGFLQIVRRRQRPSVPEIVQGDPLGAAARALLRRAERMVGAVTLQAAPAVIGHIEAQPGWVAALARRTGGAVALRAEPGLAISAGHAQISQS